jgi:hypothetical protein
MSERTASNATAIKSAVTSAPRAGLLQRKCACGTQSHGNAECSDCAKKHGTLQRKLNIGASNDPLEHDADRVAEQVMAAPMHATASRAPLRIQRHVAHAGEVSDSEMVPASVDRVLAGSGRPLDRMLRQDMEQRFGHDFSRVRVHTDGAAHESAHAVGALAYTVGDRMVFAHGQYQPHAASGRRLLAHELTHVVQQGAGVLRRTPDPAALKDFDDRAAKIKKDKVLLKQSFQARTQVNEILTITRTRDNALYYIDKLETLLSTPETPPGAKAAATSAETKKAADTEATRLTDADQAKHTGDEEAVSDKHKGKFKKVKGLNGDTFEIDASDVTDIAVRVKVHLIRTGKGTADDVKRIKSMEDAIEKRASTLGYNVDVDFVNRSGSDVFDVHVDTSQWTNSDNWADDDAAMAHELHHRLGLEEDRYDYIEAHADNADMHIDDRILWFRSELDKKVDNDPNSIMNDNVHSPLDDDVCRVAGKKTPADVDACVKQRGDARNKLIGPAMAKAAGWAFKAHARLAGIEPDSPLDQPGEPTTEQLIRRRAASMAEQLFGHSIPMRHIADGVGATRMELMLRNIQMASSLVEGCDSSPVVSQIGRPRLRLCPGFLPLGQMAQARALLRESFHIGRIGELGKDATCSTAGCDDACGSADNAEAWVRLTQCVAEI